MDRAIKIHQNIATRESLEPAQREQAGFALAQDYLKAGLLDRAEKILEPLAASGAHRMAAMRKLMRIYEQEQEWGRAIDVFRELQKAGRAAEAVKLGRDATATLVERLGPGHSEVAYALSELAWILAAQGHTNEAERMLGEAIAIERGLPRDGHPQLATSLHRLGILMLDRGDRRDAASLQREALAIREARFSSGDGRIEETRAALIASGDARN